METSKKKSNVGKIIVNVIVTCIFILVAYLALEIIIGFINKTPPCIFGHYIFVVATNSMEKTINVGDVVFVRKANFNDIQIGDIISFLDINPSDKIYGQYVTHRAFNYDGLGGIVTKGDNNPIVDSYSVTSSNFLGIVDHISPFLGGIIKVFTSNNSVIFIFMIIFLLIIVGLEVKNILMLKDKDKREKEKEKLKKEILDSIKKD